MRWPDIFFRARKRREESSSPSKPSTDTTKLAPAITPTTAIKPATAPEPSEAKDKPGESRPNTLSSTGGPALRPAVRASKPAPLTAVPAAANDDDPLKAFARVNSLRLAKKADQAASSSEPPATSTTEPPIPPLPAPAPTLSPQETTAEVKPATPGAESESSITPSAESAPASGAPGGANLRRKAKMTDLARIIPPSESGDSEPASETPSAVSPPAFTVETPVGSVTQPENLPKASETSTEETKPPVVAEAKPVEIGPVEKPEEKPPIESDAKTPELDKKPDPAAEASGPAPVPPPEGQPPKSESPHPSFPFEQLPAKPPEKKEFLLVNGERILGNVLSETPDTIYLDHGTLGVLTLPRSQIALRPVEIILINGDRIVGDIMAETPESLYVRHASLGMLTVPRAQRSTRVVEAILLDGDRIIGEVLAETENFTVIRSATLGTVPVPHNKVAMLNRKAEQVTLKALPTGAPAIEDQPKP